MWGRFFNKKSKLSDNVMPILKKLFMQGKEVKYIRCDNAGENKSLEQKCIESGLDIAFEYTALYSPQFNGRVSYFIWNDENYQIIHVYDKISSQL